MHPAFGLTCHAGRSCSRGAATVGSGLPRWASRGLLLVLQRLIRQAPGPGHALVVSLALYHYAIMAFSVLDFQGYGDAFILLHSVAFFVAATLTWSHQLLASWLNSMGRPRLALAAGVVVALVVARP